ncbi:hypothetical protein CL621_03790 [archaeon]|nr:hypothetical protein [archaeon]|tara:strand:- start:383 stop:802 length:420 start_codon:yes stop_codon:yes gene_type:complete
MNIFKKIKRKKLIKSTSPVCIDDLVGSEITLVFEDKKQTYIVGAFPTLSLFQRFTYRDGATKEKIQGDEGIQIIPIHEDFMFRARTDGDYVLIAEHGWGGYFENKFGKDPFIAKHFPESISKPNEGYVEIDRYLKSIGH